MSKKTASAAAETPEELEVDKGFTDESRPDIAGWIRPDSGLVVHATIVSAFSFMQSERGGRSKKRDVLAVRLLEPCPIVVGKETEIAPAGTVVGIGLNHALSALRYYVDSRGEFKVKFLRKESIGGGHTAWKCAGPYCRGRKSAKPWVGTVEAAPRHDGEENWDGDGAPF